MELFSWLFFHAKQECLFIIHLLWRENSSNITFSCFTCFAVFVKGKHNICSILFAECDRDRHLDKLIHQAKGWLDSSFSKFELDTFKEECEQYFDQLIAAWTIFGYPDYCSLKSAEPKEAPLNHVSCKSWTNGHLLFPIAIVLPQEKKEK